MTQTIWTEKYRPQTLKDIVGQEAITKRLQAYVNTQSLPHLILAGSAGVGKTTSALALAKQLYKETWHQNFHELNASDERGIGIIRGKIKEFARTAPIQADFKIIFLDEADSLTNDAQAALRRTIERYSTICRFILSVNYSSKIIEPIQSRCAVLRYRPINENALKKYLRTIAKQEELEITPEGIETLIYLAAGDMRKAINTLQVAATINPTITPQLLYETSATARPQDIQTLLLDALNGNYTKARSKLYDLLITYGLSGTDIITQIHKVAYDLPIPDQDKLILIQHTGETEFRLTEGANPHIQLEALLAKLAILQKLSLIHI